MYMCVSTGAMCVCVSAQVLCVYVCVSTSAMCYVCVCQHKCCVLYVLRVRQHKYYVLCVMCMSAQVRAVLAGLRGKEVRHGHRHHAQHTSHRRLRHPHAAVGQGQCTRHRRRHDVRTFPCVFVVSVTYDRSIWEIFVWEIIIMIRVMIIITGIY